jgi:hypothetical protein
MSQRRTLVLLFLLATGAGSGCGKQADTPSSEGRSTTESTSRETSPKRPDEKPLTVAAASLAQEYHADEAAAKKKYGDKLVEVEGIVSDLRNWVGGGTAVMLKGIDGQSKGKFVFLPVACYFGSGQDEKAGSLSKGQTVKVRGSCDLSKSDNIRIVGGDVTAAGPDPAIHIEAEKLAKEFAADKDKADAKYGQKFLVVQGVVRGVEDQGGSDLLVFAGADEKDAKTVRVVGKLGGFADFQLLRRIKKGQRWTIRATCSGLAQGQVEFYNPYIVPQKE